LSKFPVVEGKRFWPFRLNELVDLFSHQVTAYVESIEPDEPWVAADHIIRDIEYPFWLGRPDDTHVWNAFHGKYRRCYRVDLDFWQKASETLAVRVGDCLTGDTEIICRVNDQYTVRKIGDLKDFHGVDVLSYNFDRGSFEFRPVKRWMDKGIRRVYEVKLANGARLYCTENHKFFRVTQSETGVKEQYLGDFRPRNWTYGRLLGVRKIPALGTVDATADELYIEGQYVAEGWKESSKICISGGNVSKVKSILERLNVGYGEWKNNSGVMCVRVHSSELKERLAEMGSNAFEKCFLESRLSMSEEKIRALLEGYFDGDGTKNLPKTLHKHGIPIKSSRRLVYSTSSDKLAEQLCFAHLVLGRPLHRWYQVEHRGAGRMPIWRLTENTCSTFNRPMNRLRRKRKFNATYLINDPDLSPIPIRSIQYVGEERVYDITVDVTHNFVLESGVIAHNCEDSSVAYCAVAGRILDRGERVYEALGVVRDVRTRQILGGHGWNYAKWKGKWHLIESTLDNPPSEYPEVEDPKYPAYSRMGRKEKETRAKYQAIQDSWEAMAKPLRRAGLLSRLRWRR